MRRRPTCLLDGFTRGLLLRLRALRAPEAGFALWEMQVRERNIADARATAATLAKDFPDNPELANFSRSRAIRLAVIDSRVGSRRRTRPAVQE